MSDRDFIPDDDTALKLNRLIDAVCSQFERQWRDQQSPRIEEFLKRIPAAGRVRGLRELIALEVDLRQAAGDIVNIGIYLSSFPEETHVVREAFATLDRLMELDPHRTASNSDAAQAEPNGEATTAPIASPAMADQPDRLGRFPIQTKLGEGSFGIVYLATDSHVGGRDVALKVPHAEWFQSDSKRQQFILEATHAARLRHPGIVTIFGIETDGDQLFIIQEYLSGGDLKQRLKAGSVTCQQAVKWMIPIAEAVAFAHQGNIFHRDLKPANILLDERNQPRVADFGLALHESDQPRHRCEFAGTLPYMSPEQVRCESNRLDGRSDTWSLGVIFYEMLTGRRPFLGTKEQVSEQIKYRDPRPLRELKPDLPVELERICLKCLAKPVVERYSSASDLAQELCNWQLDEKKNNGDSLQQGPVRIVPKGLRSFDAGDADFFLDLLPGPRDRNGLPESVRFWKVRIEETDPAKTFAVGVVHGPSGCGKSSLLKAGLLPRLASHVTTVFVEATPADTEVRLLRGLRKLLPEIPFELPLPEVLAGIRDAHWNPQRKKVLIVLDQFEQWLHAGNLLGPAQLVDALRHCDGEHLQGIVLVREDFWTGISRFMQRLEIPLQEQRNAALVDRFDPVHARRVLAEFGRAFGRLPDNLSELTPRQEQFLDAAIEQLSEEGRVICVRLALFGDLIKGKPWTHAALQQAGGAAGLGVTFLEDTFVTKLAPAAHLRHEKAVRKLFSKLLPEADTDIKGSMQPRGELLKACEYTEQPHAFEELINILDDQLRLITPTDPDGRAEQDSPASVEPAALSRYYQFTHDYLVPSVRRWLNLKQAETAKGRAEIRLAERAALWHAKQDDRHLPSLPEFLNIRLRAQQRDWTDSQRKMMRRAAQVHSKRCGSAAVALVLVGFAIFYVVQFAQVERAVDAVMHRAAADVPSFICQLKDNSHRQVVLRTLREQYGTANGLPKIRLAYALAAFDDNVVPFLISQVKQLSPDEVGNLVTALGHTRETSLQAIMVAAEAAETEPDERLEARLATVQLHLGAASIAESMCQIDKIPNPTRRTLFIDEFAKWHGDIESLTAISNDLGPVDASALRSGICLGIADILDDSSAAEKNSAWIPLVAEWYQKMPDNVTHSAARCALIRFGAKLPEIALPQPGDVHEWRTNSLGMTMLKIPPGQFVRRDDLSDPGVKDQTVNVTHAFYLSDREVSVEQFQQFVEDPKYPEEDKPKDWKGVNKDVSPTPAHPVQQISWYDAIMFCNWLSLRDSTEHLSVCYVRKGIKKRWPKDSREYDDWRLIPGANGYRLPTEAEWEYACRAGTTSPFACSAAVALLPKYAVLLSEHANECGSKLPNGWGLFDMHGNVREWCQDWWSPYGEDDSVIDPEGPPNELTTKVTRGGHCNNTSPYCTSSSRLQFPPNAILDVRGFRVAADSPD